MKKDQKTRRGLRKPCSVCRTWFTADARVGRRQKTCSPECRNERRVSQRKAFARVNPDYWLERRLDERVERIRESASPWEGGGDPAVVGKVPVAYVQAKMGTEAAVIIEHIVRMVVQSAQSEMRHQVADLKEEMEKVHRPHVQVEMGASALPP